MVGSETEVALLPPVRGEEPVGAAVARVTAALRRAGVADPEECLARRPWAGPLEPYVADPELSDLEIGADGLLTVKRAGGEVQVTGQSLAPGWVAYLVGLWRANRGAAGLPVHPQTAATTGGWRYTFIPAAFSPGGATLSVRLRGRRWTLDALQGAGMLDAQTAEALGRWAPHVPLLISGGSGAGKTALQEALLRGLPALGRTVVVTQEVEFTLDAPRAVAWEINADHPQVGLAELVVQALKCQPDHLAIGEVRGAEAAEWLVAMNTGVAGGSVTVHANGPREALDKLLSLGMRAGVWPKEELSSWLAALRPLLVHVAWEGGRRRVTAVGVCAGVVHGAGGSIHFSVETLFDGTWHPERIGGRLRELLG